MAKTYHLTNIPKHSPLRATRFAIHWMARLTALALLSLVLFIIIAEVFFGDGGPNLIKADWNFRIMTVGGLTALFGFAVLWWRELLGGLLVIGGTALFYVLNFAASGRFPGGLFPFFYLPGILGIISWLLEKRLAMHQQSQ